MTDPERSRWDKLQREHGPAVWGVVYRILAHHDDARDCLQDVFLEALQNRSGESVSNWGGYLRWLATRRAIDALRHRRRHTSEALIHDPPADMERNSVEQSETVEMIRREMTLLPETQATAFWLFSMEQLTHADIATQMQSTPNAVALLIHRARVHLKIRLKHLHEERIEKT